MPTKDGWLGLPKGDAPALGAGAPKGEFVAMLGCAGGAEDPPKPKGLGPGAGAPNGEFDATALDDPNGLGAGTDEVNGLAFVKPPPKAPWLELPKEGVDVGGCAVELGNGVGAGAGAAGGGAGAEGAGV